MYFPPEEAHYYLEEETDQSQELKVDSQSPSRNNNNDNNNNKKKHHKKSGKYEKGRLVIGHYVFWTKEDKRSDIWNYYSRKWNVKREEFICTKLLTRLKQEIPCYLILHCEAQYTILFSHGNAADIGLMRNHLLDMRQSCKVNILAYEYSGYGEASGNPSIDNTYADIEAAYHYLVDEMSISPHTIVLYVFVFFVLFVYLFVCLFMCYVAHNETLHILLATTGNILITTSHACVLYVGCVSFCFFSVLFSFCSCFLVFSFFFLFSFFVFTCTLIVFFVFINVCFVLFYFIFFCFCVILFCFLVLHLCYYNYNQQLQLQFLMMIVYLYIYTTDTVNHWEHV